MPWLADEMRARKAERGVYIQQSFRRFFYDATAGKACVPIKYITIS